MEKFNLNGQDIYMSKESWYYLKGFYDGKINTLEETTEFFRKNLKIDVEEIVNSATSGTVYKTDSAEFKQ